MKTPTLRFIPLTAICFILVLAAGNLPVWALSEPPEVTVDYIFETIEVPDVDFLELTSTNDLGDYAGNTRSPDSENMVGFTLIDGVLAIYGVPDSLTFGFYGLNNAGQAVGFYQDANEISHGVIVQDGELTQFDFPGAAETEIFGVSESGLLIGSCTCDLINLRYRRPTDTDAFAGIPVSRFLSKPVTRRLLGRTQ